MVFRLPQALLPPVFVLQPYRPPEVVLRPQPPGPNYSEDLSDWLDERAIASTGPQGQSILQGPERALKKHP